MTPNFNPNKWDREKILDYVIGEQPLTDEQLEFLIYFDRLQQENKNLKEKLEENTKIYLHTSKYAGEMESKYVESNYILTEFEKWLEEQKENDLNENFIVVRLVDIKNKIQELKGIVSGKI